MGTSWFKLWTEVLKYRGISIPSLEIRGDMRVWQSTLGVTRISAVAKKEFPIQNRPPKLLYAKYLLNKFLNEWFPQGGIFRTAPKDRIPTSTEDLQAFVAFLRSPEYAWHPYREVWLAILGSNKPKAAVLFKLSKSTGIARRNIVRSTKITWNT
jgi:hypothetical protein